MGYELMTDYLHVWRFCDCEWVIARSEEDAMAILRDSGGDYDHDELVLLDDGRALTLPIDNATGEVAEPGAAFHKECLPCAGWVARFGRGYLATTEY